MSWDAYPDKKWAGHPAEFWIGMLLYLGTMVAVGLALRSFETPGAWRVLVGPIPTLPLALMWRGYLRMVRHQDELYRRIQYGVAPPLNLAWVGQLLVFSYGISAGLLTQRYG